MIGRNLQPALRAAGHDVIRLLRHPPRHGETDAIPFDPANPSPLDNFHAVIHLAGENIAKRWTEKRKASILASRADFTRQLCAALAQTNHPPAHFLAASAIGYYGYNRTEVLTEDSPSGEGFLAEVCRQWEAATAPLAASRVVHMRLATVLSPQGGALAKLLPSFRLGMGAVIGSGRQMMSWISLPDAIAAIQHILTTPALVGPVNLATPNPASNREFSKTLGQVLYRPVLLKIPAPALKLAFGQMATETILATQNAQPTRLAATHYPFQHPTLRDALNVLLTTNN
jgi:uncharacterized protein (TIGR01777 family)